MSTVGNSQREWISSCQGLGEERNGSDCFGPGVALGGDNLLWNQVLVIVAHPVNTVKTTELCILKLSLWHFNYIRIKLFCFVF